MINKIIIGVSVTSSIGVSGAIAYTNKDRHKDSNKENRNLNQKYVVSFPVHHGRKAAKQYPPNNNPYINVPCSLYSHQQSQLSLPNSTNQKDNIHNTENTNQYDNQAGNFQQNFQNNSS